MKDRSDDPSHHERSLLPQSKRMMDKRKREQKKWYLHGYFWTTKTVITGVRSGGMGKGGMCPPLFIGGQWYVCAPHFYFSLELYVYITLTNNYLAFFIYQIIILWTTSINWHRWLLLNNHISKYNSFILVLYRRYINYVFVPLFGTLLRHCVIFWHLWIKY